MKFNPVICQLPSDAQVLIREAESSDAEGLTQCIRAYLHRHFIPITPEEFNPSIAEQEKWIQSFKSHPSSLLLVVVINDVIVGNIDLTAHSRRMLNHTAVLGMGIHPGWQGKGLGKLCLQSALEWADKQPELEIIWLQVFGDNQQAIRLYQNVGFTECGRQPNFIRKPDGTCVDQITMTRLSANFTDSFHS